ncbi:MAPK kinase substrate protein At1g80180-like [Gastrolobium bilobum]|uniref:MAPK kinase substrate protein At1g80180-like n=1 Tax=Gastrolobium bilobum TaxID=150636 RepID=UPI002AB2C104|nr:MAPK kinase substrate protein At1g80180-like [Gastrolobium bilobum]
MAGLQRSEMSFRRQGSSGLVWDDRFLSGELNKLNQHDQEEEHHHHKDKGEIKDLNVATATTPPPGSGSLNTIQRSRSNGAARGYRTGKVSPAIEPPSPKLSVCGFCAAFGKTKDKGQRSKTGNRRSR